MHRLIRWIVLAGLVAGFTSALPAKHKHGRGCGHGHWDWDRRSYYRDLEKEHYWYHWYPRARWEHKQFHKDLRRAYRDYDRDYYYYPRFRRGPSIFFYWGR